MRIAVVGCSHGSLDDIYASAAKCDAEAKAKGEPPIELLLCCGDFQAMRALPDLEAMACPVKYRALGQFHNYYAQRNKAPYLTIVIGGNHESSGYMWETFHGGWLAPDIYFLGFAGCVLVDGWLRIAGASGIYKSGDYKKGHFETVPYDDRTIRSVYHIREYEVARLMQLKNRGPTPDIFLSHDWPLGIEQHGDTAALVREKPFFKEEIQSNSLGSAPLHALLHHLQPTHWFSAHLHVKFAALVHHDGSLTTVKGRGRPSPNTPAAAAAAAVAAANPDEIVLEDDDDEDPPTPVAELNEDEIMVDEEEEEEGEGEGGVFSEEKKGSGCECAGGGEEGHKHEIGVGNEAGDDEEAKLVEDLLVEKVTAGLQVEGKRTTKFLALSKPGHGKDFLQVLDIPSRPEIPRPTAPQPETEDADATADAPTPAPTKPTLYFDPHWLAIVRALHPSLPLTYQPMTPFPPLTDKLLDDNLAWIKANVGKDGILPVEAVQQFVKTAPASGEGDDRAPPSWYTNPQTEALCALLQIDNRINPVPPGFREAQAAAAEAAKVAEAARVEEAREAGRVAEDGRRAALAEAKRAALEMVDAQGEAEAENGDEVVVEDEEDE